MGTLKIYFKTIGFVFLKLLFYLLAVTAWFLILMIFALISSFLNETFQTIIFALGGIIGFLVFNFFMGIGRNKYRAGQIAMITEGILHNQIPSHPIKEGIKRVNETFSTMTPSQMLLKVLSLIKNKIMKKDDGKSLLPEIKSFLLFTLSLLIPYLGPCCMSWSFSHTDEDVFKSFVDGAGAYFHNFKKMFLSAIGNLVKMFIVSSIVVIALASFAYGKFGSSLLIVQMANLYVDAFDVEAEYAAFIIIFAIAYIVCYYAIFEFFQPFGMINVLRKYLKVAQENNDGGKLYSKFENLSDKFKTSFSALKNRHVYKNTDNADGNIEEPV